MASHSMMARVMLMDCLYLPVVGFCREVSSIIKSEAIYGSCSSLSMSHAESYVKSVASRGSSWPFEIEL